MYVTVCMYIQSLSTLVVAHKKHSPSAQCVCSGRSLVKLIISSAWCCSDVGFRFFKSPSPSPMVRK